MQTSSNVKGEIVLSESRNKLLEDIIHKGYVRAAASFSSMIGCPVQVDNKRIDLLGDRDALTNAVRGRKNMVLIVTSIIGALRGESYLLFTKDEEEVVCDMCRKAFGGGDSIKNELVLKEIDNIISAAVITEFSNNLGLRIYGDVPILYSAENIDDLRGVLGANDVGDDYYIMANANFEFDEKLSISPVFIWRFESKLATLVDKPKIL